MRIGPSPTLGLLAPGIAALALAFALAASGRGASGLPARAATSPGKSTTAATAGEDRLSQVAESALATVEAIRGDRLTRTVAREVSAPSAVRAYVEGRIRAEYPPSLIALEQARYRRMGLLPPDAALLESLLAALATNIAGFYDPDTRTLHISTGATGPLLRSVLQHEWTHALQHERVDLGRLMRRVAGGADYAAAAMALLEGEAMAVDFLARTPPGAPGAAPPPLADRLAAVPAALDGEAFAASMPGVPPVFVEEIRFAYGAGLAAVLAAHRRGGWEAVERWQATAPPLSTEHVLHPERAFGPERDCPKVLTLPALADALPAGAALSETETLGEAGWRAFLRVHLDRGVSDAAAAGWDGDTYAALTLPAPAGDGAGARAAPALLLVSEWDSAEDAAEVVRAVGAAAARTPALRHARWERRRTRVVGWIGDGPPPAGLLKATLDGTRAREVCDHRVFEAARRPAAVPPGGRGTAPR